MSLPSSLRKTGASAGLNRIRQAFFAAAFAEKPAAVCSFVK
jgi:hypothetical protein